MPYRDLVKQAATVNGTGAFTLGAAAAGGYQSMLGGGRAIGDPIDGYLFRLGSEWEAGKGTIGANNTLVRSPTASSNGGALVNFAAGTGEIEEVVNADAFNKFASVSLVPFSTSIPLDRVGMARMVPKVVNGPITFSPAGGAVIGSLCRLSLTADGVNVPNFGPFKESTGSSGYDNRNGIVNEVAFEYNGTSYFMWIAQDAAAVPVVAGDTIGPTLTNATGASTGTNSASGAVTTNDGTGTLRYIASANTTESEATLRASVASKPVTAAGSQTVAVAGLAPNTQYRLHYLHVDPSNNASNVISSAPFTTAAPGDNVAPILSNPTATKTGQTTATGTVSTDENNGFLYRYASPNAVESAPTVIGAAQSQAVTAAGVQNVTFAGLPTGSTLYAHYVHVDAAGNPSLVANSGSFQTDAGAVYDTMIPNGSVTESGTSPRIYTGIQEAGNLNYGWGANWTKHAAAQTDFSLQFKLTTHVEMWCMTLMPNSSAVFAADSINGVLVQFDDNYQAKGNTGNAVVKSLTKPQNDDIVRMERVDSAGAAGNTATLKVSYSRGGAAFVPVFEVTSFPNGEMWPRFHHSGFMIITELQSTGLIA